MSKYDEIWPRAREAALQLKGSGYTPQQVCTALSKQFFNDTDKYNTVKGWHVRTFPDDWSAVENKSGARDGRRPISRHRVQQRPLQQSDIPHRPQVGYSLQTPPNFLFSQHQQDDYSYTHNDFARQALAAIINSRSRQDTVRHQQNGGVAELPHAAAADAHYKEHIYQYQPSSYTMGMIPASHHDTEKQDSSQYHYPGLDSQMLPADLDSPCQHGQSFLDLSQTPYEIEHVEDKGGLEGGFPVSARGQQLNGGHEEATRQPDMESHPQRSNLLPQANHESVPPLPAAPFAIGSRHDHTNTMANPQQLSYSFEGQRRTAKPSAKHYRASSMYDDPTPPPQCPLPPIPPENSGVIHRGHNQTSWRPILVRGSRMVKVNPDGFKTDHPWKRVKGQPGSKTRDSLARYQSLHDLPKHAPPGGPASHLMQSDPAQSPAASQSGRASSASINSDFRDSGYASFLDSAVLDPIRCSLSSLNLADDVNFKMERRDVDDGFVDVKVKVKLCMRRSYIEKYRDDSAPALDPASLAG